MIGLDELADELVSLLPDNEARPFSVEALAGGHVHQLAAMRDRSNWIHLLCDRQAGKTWSDMGILLDNALERPHSLGVFLGLVGTGLTVSVWPKWKLLCERFSVDCRHNNTEKLTTFPNGAMVVFGGTDDLTHVRKYLGNRLDDCVFIVDEAQAQKRAMLEYLIDNLLPPMCTPTTRVILSGVLPDVPVGMFLDLAEPDAASDTGGRGEWRKWSHHSWGRLDNVHTPEAAQMLAQLEATKGAADPQLLRDWKRVQRVWSKGATAYGYDRSRCGYRPTLASWATPDMLPPGVLLATVPPAGVDTFAIGLDPAATSDRFAVVLWGWSRTRRMGVWQVAEWVTPRRANALESQWLAVVKLFRERYGLIYRTIRDAGSAATVNDLLYQTHGIIIEPAIKGPGSLRARVDRFADLLSAGEAHIIEGSQLEEDLIRAAWDKDARDRGEWKWDSQHHPDVGDAGGYAIPAYVETAPKPVTPSTDTEDQAAAKVAAAALKQRLESAGRPPPPGAPRIAGQLWGQRPRRPGGW
jgi:hypothetical protein